MKHRAIGSSAALPSRHSTARSSAAAAVRATVSIGTLGSTPTTYPPTPSLRAAVRATIPAGNVQHALTRTQRGHLDEIVGPRTKNTRDQVALVTLRNTSAELPLRLCIHLTPRYVRL